MTRDIDALNAEMVAKEVRVFVGGLHPSDEAKGWEMAAEGDVKVFEGPYLRTGEHVGGFWVIEAPSMDDAMEWGRKAAIACRAPVEVRQFH